MKQAQTCVPGIDKPYMGVYEVLSPVRQHPHSTDGETEVQRGVSESCNHESLSGDRG